MQEAEYEAAKRRILAEAARQRGTPEDRWRRDAPEVGRQRGTPEDLGRHRWNDGPTIRLTPLTRQAPLLTYGQRRGYRCER
ncbi:hypothetical protein [Micromonospora sp. SH-82]|uniref:hypothetical protein n=1 Tax=Micromonospora sp. SH-82 TaxID=3132938 RepID=UPI003EB71D17